MKKVIAILIVIGIAACGVWMFAGRMVPATYYDNSGTFCIDLKGSWEKASDQGINEIALYSDRTGASLIIKRYGKDIPGVYDINTFVGAYKAAAIENRPMLLKRTEPVALIAGFPHISDAEYYDTLESDLNKYLGLDQVQAAVTEEELADAAGDQADGAEGGEGAAEESEGAAEAGEAGENVEGAASENVPGETPESSEGAADEQGSEDVLTVQDAEGGAEAEQAGMSPEAAAYVEPFIKTCIVYIESYDYYYVYMLTGEKDAFNAEIEGVIDALATIREV